MQKVHHFPLIAFFILFQVLFTPFLWFFSSFPRGTIHYQSLIYILSLRVVSQFSIFSLLSFLITVKYTGFPLFFLFFNLDKIILIIDFVRHYFQYLCWFLFLPLLRSFSLWGFIFFLVSLWILFYCRLTTKEFRF